MNKSELDLIQGSGNIFRDLGEPEADLKHAKAVLAARIISTLDKRGLSVRKAGTLTGYAAADFSRIRNADLGCFTLDRLMKVLGALGEVLHTAVRVQARGQHVPMGHPPSRREACPESSQEDCLSLSQQRGTRKGAYDSREEDKQRLRTDPNPLAVELGPQRNL